MRKSLALTFLLLCASATAFAQAGSGNPENWCRNGFFPADGPDFKIARVVGAKGARAYFHGDEGECPKVGGLKCRTKSYLIPGDEVIVARVFGGWACGWYQPRRGSETVGWLPVESLSFAGPTPAPTLEQWVGDWRFYDQSLEIKAEGGVLKVEGQALWRGLGDNVHVGEVNAAARPQGDVLSLVEEEGGCAVTLKMVGSYLVVRDNAQCGGANVRFDGVYRKRARR